MLVASHRSRRFAPSFPNRPIKAEPAWLFCPGCKVLQVSDEEYIDAVGFNRQEVFQLAYEILQHGNLPTTSNLSSPLQLELPGIAYWAAVDPAWWIVEWHEV